MSGTESFSKIEIQWFLFMRFCPRLPRYYVQTMAAVVLCACMVTPVLALDDMWTVTNRIIVDVYGKIAGISTVLAGLMSAVAVVGGIGGTAAGGPRYGGGRKQTSQTSSQQEQRPGSIHPQAQSRAAGHQNKNLCGRPSERRVQPVYSTKNTSVLSRLISGVLAAVLLLPMLVFTALPNTVFGFASATDQGIVDFTASAQRLTNAYQDIERKKQSALDRLVNTILPGFSDYDDYHVTDGSGGMNQNRLIAIGSVRYKQDLNIMDDDALEELLYGKLDYSASITDRVLNISVWDLTPEAYMDRLGFSQEEKDWAALLYSVMAEEQRVTVGDTVPTAGGTMG